MAILTADVQGVVKGKFTIPANVPAGTKKVDFIGAASVGTRGSTTFTGQGTLITDVFQDVTTITRTFWNVPVDPLAQTFTLDRDTQLAGVDLWFTAVGGDARVQLRTTQNGHPTPTVMADVTVAKANLVVGGSHTRVVFPALVTVRGGEEYCVVILADDATTALSIAELGKFDATHQTWVTSQPYTVGTLLSSSNAKTWTAHQDRDLTFRLLEADFTAPIRELNMGQVQLSGVTDLLVTSLAESPTAATRLEYDLALPSGETLRVAPGQVARVDAGITGKMGVKARLTGNAVSSPVLWPGTQVISGVLKQTGDYYTRSIPATAATKALLIYDAIIPSGATVTPKLQKDNDAWGNWTADGTTQQGDGLVEYRFKATLSNVNLLKAKLTLTGTPSARSRVRNIRFMAVL